VGLAELQAQARAAAPTAVERVMPRLVVGQEKAATIEGNDQLITQSDLKSQAKQLLDEGMQLYVHAKGSAKSLQQSLRNLETALPLWRKLGDRSFESLTLNVMGNVFSAFGEKQKALDYYQQALLLARTAGVSVGEATVLHNIGKVYADLSKYQKALEYYQQALPLLRVIGDRSKEVSTLSAIGCIYRDLGEKQKALDYYSQALPIQKAVGDRAGEAMTLTNIGSIYEALGEKQKALVYNSQALPLWKSLGDRSGEAVTSHNIGSIYNSLGEKQKALNYYSKSLPLSRAVDNRSGEATTLNHIGTIYSNLGENRKALDYYQQELRLWRAVGNRSKEAAALTKIGRIYADLGERKRSLDYYSQALSLYREVGDRGEEAFALYSIGRIYNDSGKQQKALEFYQQALLLYKKLGDKVGESSTLSRIAVAYDELGEKQKALDAYQQALPLWRAGGYREREATILNNIGFIYDALGARQKALNYFSQALLLYRALGHRSDETRILNNIARLQEENKILSAATKAVVLSKDAYQLFKNGTDTSRQQAIRKWEEALLLWQKLESKPKEALVLVALGSAYDSLGSKSKALEYYTQALPIYQQLKEWLGETVALNNIGLIYSHFGEMQKALDYYQQGLVLLQNGRARGLEATTLKNIGKLYKDLGENQKALDYYKQAWSLSQTAGEPDLKAIILSSIGSIYADLEESQKALDYFQRSLALSQTVGDRRVEATTLSNIGTVYSDLGLKHKALDYHQQALSSSRVLGNLSVKGTTLNNIGTAYYDLGEKQKALDYYQQALSVSRATGIRFDEAAILKNIAFLEVSRENLQAALAPMQASIKIVEELRTRIISPELRQSYFATVQDYYRFYINLLMDLHQQNPTQGYDKQAFNISERSRARTLLEQLTEANANIKEGIDPELLAHEKALQSQLYATEKQRLEINSNPKSPPDQKATIDKQYTNLLAQYQTLQNEIRAKSPKYAALKYPQPLTLALVQNQLLDSDTTLLQYSLGKERSFLWVVSRDGLQSHILPSEKEIETQVKSWRSALLDKPDASEALDGPASRLGRLLLEPAAAALKSQRRVIVVPDGALNYAPFAALRLEGKPLVESHTLLQLPSSSTLALIRSQTAERPPAPRGLAMVADPIFSGDDPRITTPARTSQPAPTDLASLNLQRASRALPRQRSAGSGAADSLPRLPGTRREAERILPLFPGNQTLLALNSQASLALLQSPSMKDYRYVHLATHGVFNTAEPALSGVILSLVDQQGRAVNGFLRLNEIFNLNLPAELVVLSACETGLGEQIRGEGMVGLTRGFLYAGSRRLLVSLWKVDDDATAALMSRFYDGLLREKLTPAQALRAAQNHLRTNTNWDSPYFWSSFVLQGEW
jgi:CHAT domain-containing protein/Tfp pilus assembly protein PilF